MEQGGKGVAKKQQCAWALQVTEITISTFPVKLISCVALSSGLSFCFCERIDLTSQLKVSLNLEGFPHIMAIDRVVYGYKDKENPGEKSPAIICRGPSKRMFRLGI